MKSCRLILVVMLALILASTSVFAISIGISPGRVNLNDVLRDGYAERTITLSTNTEEILNGHFEVRGDVAPWVRFDPPLQTFEMSGTDPYELTVIVEPPGDIPQGNYTGTIEFITDGIGGVGGRAGGIVKTAVVLILNTEVSGSEIIDCRAGGIGIKDLEEGFPMELNVKVINDGNVRLAPTINIDVWDQLQENIVFSTELTGDTVFPTRQEDMFRQIEHSLGQGQYWADVEIEECNTQDIRTFSIVERGGIVDSGNLVSILNKPWITLGETVEVLATFSNTGPRAVDAKFNGVIRRDDTIVKIVETEELLVPAGEDVDFQVLFTPFDPGRYTLTGRVTYNKKLTFEKGTVINVLLPEEEKKQSNWTLLLLYLIIIFVIIFLIRKIRKEKQRKKHGF